LAVSTIAVSESEAAWLDLAPVHVRVSALGCRTTAQSDGSQDYVRKPDPAGLTLHFDPAGALLQSTLDCENDVFVDRYGEDRTALEGYHAPYTGASTFLSLADDEGHVVAMARLVFPSPAGLITLVDIADDPWRADADAVFAATGLDPARTWDVSAVCVRKAARGQTALFAATIYHGMIRAMQVNRVDGFVAMLDTRVRRILNMLGVVLHPLPGIAPLPFWGSPETGPSYAHFDSLIAWQRRSAPDAYRLVTLGVGLDGIRVPGPDAFTLRRPRSVQLARQRIVLPAGIDLTAGTTGSGHPQAAERDGR
jgi:hypothetical protein